MPNAKMINVKLEKADEAIGFAINDMREANKLAGEHPVLHLLLVEEIGRLAESRAKIAAIQNAFAEEHKDELDIAPSPRT